MSKHKHDSTVLLIAIPFITLMAFASLAVAQDAMQSKQFQADTGPVTVTWSQPATLPNAADYQVKISDLDRNGDGRISRNEVPVGHALASEFKLVDRNHDGFITAAEL